jgi:hypothetical protein
MGGRALQRITHILWTHFCSFSFIVKLDVHSKLQRYTASFTVGITLHTEMIFSCILLKWLLYVTWLLQDFILCTPWQSTQGILYLQNIKWFHSTQVHIISCTPIQKVRPSLYRFSKTAQMLNNICADFLNWISSKQDKQCGKHKQKLIYTPK